MRIPIIASLSFSHREDLRIRSGRGRERARGHRCAWGRRPTRLFRPIDPARLIADANGPAGGVVRRLGKEAGALPASAPRPSSSSHSSTNPDEKGSVYRSDIVKILLNAAGAGRRGGARGARLRRHRPLEFGENVLAGPAGSGAPHGPAPRARGDESSGESHGRRAGGLAEPRPVWPGISARGPGRGDRRCPRRRHRTDAPYRSLYRSSGSGPGRPRPSGRIGSDGRGPIHRGGGRAVAQEGLGAGDSSHRGGGRHGARLLRRRSCSVVRRRSRPAPRCRSGGEVRVRRPPAGPGRRDRVLCCGADN